MSDALKAKIKQRVDFDNPSGEAMLNLMAAADVFRGQLNRLSNLMKLPADNTMFCAFCETPDAQNTRAVTSPPEWSNARLTQPRIE